MQYSIHMHILLFVMSMILQLTLFYKENINKYIKNPRVWSLQDTPRTKQNKEFDHNMKQEHLKLGTKIPFLIGPECVSVPLH